MKSFAKKLIPLFLIDFYHFLLPLAGAFLYGFPSKKLIVFGVTGTNGKSTVVDLAARILEEAGNKVASLSSVRFKIGDKEWKNSLKMTMPGRFQLQKFLRQAVNNGCKYAVLEVTSEGIKQHRHGFINFHTAVFTNLTPEHIESHGGLEKYREAKARLFQSAAKIHIINLDDENSGYFLRFPAEKKIGYGLKTANKEKLFVILAENVRLKSSGVEFSIKEKQFNLSLLGEFNVYNALAAVCVGLSRGIDLETCKRALEKAKGVPGRMEVVVKDPFAVIVDYAHTPDALEKVYQTIKNTNSGKMICVLGAAGGGRDKWKRPEMGKIAVNHCNQIILTNEDPYDENPLKILEEIESGFSQFLKYKKTLDRREAIREALNFADSGDTVIITGKGSEPWMCVEGGKKIPWDDRAVVREELKKLTP